MPQVALLSKVHARDGKSKELIAALRPLLEQAANEPGTLLYALHGSKDDPDLFWITELYADSEALAAHQGSQAMATAAQSLGALIAESELSLGEPVVAKGLPT